MSAIVVVVVVVANICWSDKLEQFSVVSQNQNKSNYTGQSQKIQKIHWANQNSKQIQVADAKRGKMCARVTIGFGFTSDWPRKWHNCVNQSPTSEVKQNQRTASYFRKPF